MSRLLPNILITGTPGTGKTTTAELVALYAGVSCLRKHIEGSKLVKERRLHDGYDEKFDSYLLNEDKMCDELESEMEQGGVILDFHSCEFFPERWFDLVVVLRTDNTILYDRLEARGYSKVKIQENLQCEIMQVLLEEAMQSYDRNIVVELKSDSIDDMESNVDRISEWIQQWLADNNNNNS